MSVNSVPVFIGGSRKISRLNAQIREKLTAVVCGGHPILIGDANGADKAVQFFLSELGYSNVTVFCTERCRNNVGGWPTRIIHAEPGTRGFAFYAAKDRAMSSEAGCGIMLWDGASRGTLENIVELLREGRKVLVYIASKRAFQKLEGESGIDRLMAQSSARATQTSGVKPRAAPPEQLRLG